MSQEELRQRIQYLARFGGVFPEKRPPWLPWAAALVGLVVVDIALLIVLR